MTIRLLPLMTALILALAACGGGDADGTDTPEPSTPEPSPTGAAETPADTGTAPPAEGEATSVFELEIGDCFDTEQEDVVEEVDQVDCAAPHEYELYATIDHPGGNDDAYPGDAELATFAEQECIGAFEGFVGETYEDSELFIYYLQPSENTWTVGDREVLCALYLPDGTLEGSMEGSGR
ncbi:MAG: septum formation family protein [Candidatus Limnocylindria bacterium]